MMKKRTKKTVSRVISGVLAALFLVGIGFLGLSGLGNIHAKACDFELDEGVAWSDERTYYMPGDLISEGDWIAFRGSNGMVYEINDEILEQIGGSKGLGTDEIYLLTMDSNSTKEWYDDTILVVWRDVL
nr:MAG TPA: Membrane fusion protein p14 fusion protein transmembrane domain [Caudoviricetes sp.]